MTATADEVDAMHRAILLSAFGLGRTSPNPPVGCVILDPAGQIVGEGYHERKGEAHAEVHALTAAGERARGGTAVVTLEPCNHHGRTPPCRQALIDAGVSRTVIALIDPTSREEGGAERLRAAGVDVEVGVLAESARLVLGPWLHSQRLSRPHVTWLHELDPAGRVIPPNEDLVAQHRTTVDAVLDGNGRIAEGVPNAHGGTVFSLPTSAADDEPTRLLTMLYTGGARSLLLIGDTTRAQPFLRDRLVDHMTFYALPASPSGAPAATPTHPAKDFTIDRVGGHGRYIRVDAAATGLPDHTAAETA